MVTVGCSVRASRSGFDSRTRHVEVAESRRGNALLELIDPELDGSDILAGRLPHLVLLFRGELDSNTLIGAHCTLLCRKTLLHETRDDRLPRHRRAGFPI